MGRAGRAGCVERVCSKRAEAELCVADCLLVVRTRWDDVTRIGGCLERTVGHYQVTSAGGTLGVSCAWLMRHGGAVGESRGATSYVAGA